MASQTEQIQIAFKHTLDIYGARSDRQWFEETYGAKHVVVASDVWSKTPPYNDPTTGISQGIVTSEIDFVLTLDPFSSNRLWVAKTIPGSWPFLGSLTNWVLLNSQRIKNWVSPTIFGASYVFVLKQNNGTLIPTGNWEWNFSEGLLHLDDGNTVPDKGWLAPLKLTGFRYIGPFVGASTGFGSPVQAITDLRAVSSIERADKQIRLVEDKKAIYAFDTSGLGSDDGDTTIVPGDVIVPAPGRWFRTASAGQDHESLTGLLGGAPNDHVHLSSTLVGYVPTSGEKSALAGTSGTPGPSNKYVTDGDSRNTNSRAPTAHGTNHKEGGGDEVATATSAANAIPKADAGGKLDSWVTANAIAATPSLRKLGTGSTDACAGDDTRLLDEKVKLSAVDPTAGYLEDKITGSGTNSTKLGVGAAATGTSSVSFGYNAQATALNAVAIGGGSGATSSNTTSFGQSAQANSTDATAIGYNAQAKTFAGTTAVGSGALATGLNSVAVGLGAQAISHQTASVGQSALAGGVNAVAYGYDAHATGGDTLAFGSSARAGSQGQVSIGANAGATSGNPANAVAIGSSALGYNLSVAIGFAANAGSIAGNGWSIAIGGSAAAAGNQSVAIGYTATASQQFSVAVGYGALASAVNSMAVGWGTTASGTSSIAIGVSTSATQLDSSAVGSGANASGLRGSAFGRSAQATFADSTAVGYNAQAVALNSAAFGSGAQALGPSSYALGKGSIASGGNSVAIGSLATTVGSGGDAIAIGVLASSATYASVVIGRLASAGGSGTTKVAIGYTAAAGGDGAVAVGQNTIANGDGSVAIGKTASTVAYLNALAIGEGALATANNDGQIGSAIKPINLTGYGDLNWPGGFVHQVGPWEQDNVAAGQSVVALFLTGSVTRTGRVAVRAGSILGVVVRSNEAQTAGTLTVEVTKNGVGVGLTAVLDGINTTVKASTQAKGVDTFVAGDSIGVIITTDGAWAPTTADITVEVLIEE